MGYYGYEFVGSPDIKKPHSRESYTCAYCNTNVSGFVVSEYKPPVAGHQVKWLLCTNCGSGSVLNRGELSPGSLVGPIIEGLPQNVLDAYKETRRCMSVNAYTACELLCRNILMHTAVEKGAKEGESFADYLTYLEGQGYVTPPMKSWVDLIRQHGNKAAHLLEKPDRKRAESTLMFTAELLRLIYEMEHLGKQYAPKPQSTKGSKP